MKRDERIAMFEEKMPEAWKDTNIVEKLAGIGYFDEPASVKRHGAYEGGLFMHSYQVALELMKLTERNRLEWQRKESPFIVGVFHDLCKTDFYEKDENGLYTYKKDTLFQGHGEKSVMIASTIMQLTEEEAACICYHMGAFRQEDQWKDYTNAIHAYPNVLWTHTADMIAAHIYGV